MASSKVEFASSTSPFGCINTTRNHHHRVTQAKNLFNHFIRDHINNNNNGSSHSWDTNNKAKNNLGTLRFGSNNKRDQQDESLLSMSASPNHEEPSPSLSSSSSLPLRKQRPPPISIPSDFSSPCDGVLNLGASSLVQMWEKRLTQSSNTTTKSWSTPKSSPNSTSSSLSPQSSSSSEADSSPQGQIHHNEGDHLRCREHHQSEGSVVRVADIIKRLTATSSEEIVDQAHHQDHQNYYCVGSPEQSLIENGSFVIRSPRIRGRQGFNDLLMQMERDRHGELNNLADRAPVSKFSHKCRIQALLRLRLMQRGIVAKDPRGSPSTTSQMIKPKQLPQGSVIMRLRERFSLGIKNGTASIEAEVAEPRTPDREKENKVSSPVYNLPNPTQNPVFHTDHNNKEEEEEEEEAPPCSDVSVMSSEARNAETNSSSMADMNAAESEVPKNVEGIREEKHINNVSDGMEEEEEGSYEDEYGEKIYDEIKEEEQVESSEANFDWISQISKPKSYWEDLRQAWYKEVLDGESQNNGDIYKLLQRRTVSNFLCSDFREKMDKLMESHKGTQADLLASQEGDEEVNPHEEIGQLIAILLQKMDNPAKEEEAAEEEDDEEEEEEILISSSYNGESDSMNHSSSPSQWRFDDDSASLTQPSQSPYFFHNNFSLTNNPPSIEMELIYDLKGHMKQLYQEMSELRKSLRSCIDMQMSLQKSFNRENDHTAKGKKSHDRVVKKGNCCICSKTKADSLFYRCGHMCTCLKCANKLQWKKGMCPICEAPIVDVVRVYVDA